MATGTRAGTAYIDFEGDFSKLRRQIDAAGREVSRKMDKRLDSRGFRDYERDGVGSFKRVGMAARAAAGDVDGSNRRIGSSFGRAQRGSEGLANSVLRMKLVLGALAFGPAVSGANALASGALALTSSLGPLVGTLAVVPSVAGAAGQALATIKLGTLGVGEALKAANDSITSGAEDSTAAMDRQQASAERVRGAKLALADAQRSAKFAQQDLTIARADARRELEDLRLAAERGAEAEEGSALALRRARAELRQVEGDPKSSMLDVEEALHRVDEAETDLKQTKLDARRGERDHAEARRKGVNGMEEVVQAQRGVEDTNRGVAEAAHQVAVAQRDATQAMGKQSSAATRYQQAMAELSPAAQRFVRVLMSYRPVLKDLQGAAAQGLFPGAERGLAAASKNTGVLRKILKSTGVELGSIAEKTGKFLGRQDVGKDIAVQGQRNTVTIRRFGQVSLHLVDALRHVTLAAGPLVNWLTKLAVGWSKNVSEEAKAGRESGRLAAYFERTRAILTRLGSILGHVGRGFAAIFRAGRTEGDSLWASFDRGTAKFERWAKSVRGQADLRSWFRGGRATLDRISDAIRQMYERFRQLRREGRSSGEAVGIALSEGVGRALSSATERLAENAPKLASAFVRGFLASDVWGKLAIGGWLWMKFGGRGAGLGLGSKLAAAMASGMSGKGGIAGKAGSLLSVRGSTPANPLFVSMVGGGGGVPGGKGGKVPPIIPAGKPSLLMRAAPWLFGAAAVGHTLKEGVGAMRTPALQGRAKGPREALGKTVDIFAKVPGPVQGVGKLGQRLGLGQGETDKVKKRLTGIKFEAQQLGKVLGKPIRLRLDADPKRAVKDLRSIRANFDFLRKSTFVDMRTMLRTTGDTFTRIKRTMDLNSSAGRKAVTDNFRAGAGHIKSALQNGEISTREGMRAINRLMKQHTGAGKEAVRTNMFEVRKILAATMDRGVSITDKGAGRIRRIFRKELKAYDVTGRQAELYLQGPQKGGTKGDTHTGMPTGARGGLVGFGRPGARGPDNIPVDFGGQKVAVGSGEVAAVFNGPQLPEVQRRFADVGGLRGFFRRRWPKHSMARGGALPGYATGGIVPVPGEPGTTIHKSILDDVVKLDRRYKLDINDGYAPTGHAAGGDHPKGMGFDAGPDFGAGGSWGLVSQLAKWAEPQQNQVRSPFRWIGYTGDPNHGPGDHIHVGFKGPGIKGLGGDVGKIARQIVGGPDSALKGIVQKILDRSRGSAQRRLDSITAGAGGAGGVGAGPVKKGAASRSQMVRWARSALEQTSGETGIPPSDANVEKILELARKESGWDPKSMNLWDSNAKAGNPSGGLMHVTIDKVGGSKAKLHDPVLNMMASIRYQAKKFSGQLTTQSPYAQGGIVEAARGLLGGRLGTVPSASEVKRQEVAVKKLEDKKKPKKEADQKRLARDLSNARKRLKGMKGSRRKGLAGRKRGQERLSERVKSFMFPEGLMQGLVNHERNIEDLGSIYDQFEADYRVDEILDQTELNDLVARKTGIRDLIGGDPLGTSGTIAWIRDALVPMVTQKIVGVTDFIERLKTRVRKNLSLIKAREAEARKIRRQIKAKNTEIAKIQGKKKKTDGDKSRLKTLHGQREKLSARLGVITQREIPALEQDNVAVAGTGRPKPGSLTEGAMEAGENALLPDAYAVRGKESSTAAGEGGIDLRGHWVEFMEKLRPGSLQSEWKGHDLAIKALLREGATKPEPPTDELQSQRADLLKEELSESRLRTAVSEAHFGVLRQTPFGGVFHEGGVVAGPVGAERMILAKAGETVTPAGEGPDVRVLIEDHRTRVFVDDVEQIAENVVDRRTRSLSRGGHRPLPGRAGVLA